MPFQIKTPALYLAGEENRLVVAGGDLITHTTADKPPTIKSAVVHAALDAYRTRLAADLAAEYKLAAGLYEIMGGDVSDLSDDLATRMQSFIDKCGADINDYLDGAVLLANGPDECSKELARIYVTLLKPAGPHMGKFLSAIGITEPMLQVEEKKALAAREQRLKSGETTTFGGQPIVPLPPAPPGAHFGANTTASAPVGAAPPPPPPSPPPPNTQGLPIPEAMTFTPTPPAATPDKAAISAALKLWYNDGGPNIEAFAKAMGISPATLRNRCSGRTEGAITASQAKVILSDIDVQIGNLNKAAAVLSAIRT